MIYDSSGYWKPEFHVSSNFPVEFQMSVENFRPLWWSYSFKNSFIPILEQAAGQFANLCCKEYIKKSLMFIHSLKKPEDRPRSPDPLSEKAGRTLHVWPGSIYNKNSGSFSYPRAQRFQGVSATASLQAPCSVQGGMKQVILAKRCSFSTQEAFFVNTGTKAVFTDIYAATPNRLEGEGLSLYCFLFKHGTHLFPLYKLCINSH